MKLNVRMLGASETRKMLDAFSRATGKGVEQGIREIAMSSARALVRKVQPFGTGAAKGRKFIENLGRQVDQAYIGTNVGAYPATTDMKTAHYQVRRNGKIRPRQFRKQRGNPWLGLIKEDEHQRYRKQVQAKAGRAKGAWVEAGNSLRVGRMTGISQWINRHNATGYGGHTMLGRSFSARVQLWNRTPYLSGIQTDAHVKAALAEGRRNGIKRMQIIINKATKSR